MQVSPLFSHFATVAGVSLALLAARPATAQYRLNARGWAKTAGGLNLGQLAPNNANFKDNGKLATGLNYRFFYVEAGTLRGRVGYTNPAFDGAADVRVNRTYLGGYLPIGLLSAGKRRLGMRGGLIYPFLTAGVGRTRYLSTYSPVLRQQVDFSSYDWYVAPGVSLQLPYFTVDVRAQGTRYYSHADFADAPCLRGWVWQPTVSLQFDLLYDIFSPKMSDVGHMSGYAPRSSWSSSGSTATRTTTFSHQSVSLTTSDVGTFVALTPRYTWATNNAWRGDTRLAGLGVSWRSGAAAADVWADGGQRGIASSFENIATLEDPAPTTRKVNEADDQFAGWRYGGRVMARGGLDVFPLMKAMFLSMGFADPEGHEIKNSSGGTVVSGTSAQMDSGSGFDLMSSTGFSRVILGVGLGGAYAGKLHMLHPDQEINLDRKFADGNPGGFVRNTFTDPRMGSFSLALQAYAAVEVGCATFSVERTSYGGDALAKETTVSVSWLLPMKRLGQAHRAIKEGAAEARD